MTPSGESDSDDRVQMYNLDGRVPDWPRRLLEWPDYCTQVARADNAELARDRLADALAELATIAPGGTRWPAFELPTEHRTYAVGRFLSQTTFAGGAEVHHARRALAREYVRKAQL